jgi:putative hydrolase of the HAD superfamily
MSLRLSSAAVPEAVIFDFGGVLTTPVWDSFASFCRERGLADDAVKRLFREDPDALGDLRELEKGELDEAEYERRFAERLDLDSPDGLVAGLFGSMLPEERMLEAVRSARSAGAKTGLLSNSWSTSHYDREALEEIFDAIVISGEVGLHKPQPEIYRLCAERLGVEPSACVFVDDLRENCEGAEAVGMTAIRHRDAAATVRRLEELLGARLR